MIPLKFTPEFSGEKVV